MSDSNNNPYGCHVMRRNDDDGDVTMVAADNKDTDCFHKLDRQISRDSLAQFGMDIGQSSADEDAFFSDDMQVTSQAHARARKPFHANHRYTKTKVRKRSHCASHSSRHSSVTSRTTSSRRSSLKRKKSKSKAPVSSDIPDQVDHDVTDKVDRDVTDDVIFEHDEVPLSRSISHPTVLSSSLAERRSRLVRRRSAITYTSTYRTLSVPPRLSPIRPSLGSLVMSATPSIASVVSVPEVCCYPAGLGRAHLRERTSWSNLMTCLAHKKENGYKMTQTELMIRKALEKAIKKAGYNMNELDLTQSPCSSPSPLRKLDPKSNVDWTDGAMMGEHVWAPSTHAGDLCYVGEAYCKKSGGRKRCSACHIIVHDACLDQLDKIQFQCKVSFRESNSRNLRENMIVRHHWVHRRRQEGKCKHCGKGFEKRFGFRDSKILAISCSWCKEAYHNKASCFTIQKIREACTLGAHARIIVPPTWVVKWSPKGRSIRNRSKRKRGGSGILRKRSQRDFRHKPFTIRPLPEHTPYLTPTIVFINPKSGGNQGVKILQTFQWLLNQRQVFNLSEGGPKEALEMFRKVPNLRILACGGDGTVGWILSALDELNFSRSPPVAILPLGTGNDLSRTLNWGSGYSDEPISKILQHVEEGKVVQMDRWKLDVKPNLNTNVEEDEASGPSEGVDRLPLSVVNNYFSFGADAEVVLEFHESREARPSKFNSRIGNKIFYARTGVTDYLLAKHKNLGKRLRVVCDGKDMTAKIQALKPISLVFLNIPRYSAGTMPWGNPTGTEFEPQRHDDKLIEVLALTSNQLGLIYVGGHGERLCQCREAVIETFRPIPVQIDGEPCRLNPSVITISFLNQANMIYKTKRGMMTALPDMPVNEQMKICINTISFANYEKHNGDKAKLRELSKPSHTAVISSDADLETVRTSFERMHQQLGEEKGPINSDFYTFLDLSAGDRFYRIDRTQESMQYVREVATSDGELFVLDSTPPPQPATEPSELDRSKDLSLFPRSQLIDKKTVVRRRIHSDTAATTDLANSSEMLQSTTVTKPRSQTQLKPDVNINQQQNQCNHDVITVSQGRLDSDKMTHVQKLATPSSGDTGISNNLKKPDSKASSQADSLSDSFHDLNVNSTKTHCDVTNDEILRSSSISKTLNTDTTLCDNASEIDKGNIAIASSKQNSFLTNHQDSYAENTIVTSQNSEENAHDGPGQVKFGDECNNGSITNSTDINSNPLDGDRDDFEVKNPVSRKNHAASISSIPSPKRNNDATKNDVNKSGLSLSVFVKTQRSVSLGTPPTGPANVLMNKQLSNAAKRGDLSKLKAAIETGADMLSLDGDGASALHNAARFNHPEIAQYLIDQGPADLLNLTDKDRQQTALHKAAWFGHKKVCEVLVNAGASLIILDYKGMTALQRAEQAEDTRLVAFLSQEALKRLKSDKETPL